MEPRTNDIRVDADEIMPIVWRAARLFRDRDKVQHTEQKGYGNYVTEADKAVQQEIRTALAARYPAVQFYAEEKDNGDVDVAGDYWILDPIDGTMNLMRDYAHSAISLGYAQGGTLVLGIIYDPFRDEMFYGEQGRGAYLLRTASSVFGDTSTRPGVESAAGLDTPVASDDSAASAPRTAGVASVADAPATTGKTRPTTSPLWTRIHVSTAQTLADSVAIVGTAPYNRDEFGNAYKESIWQVFMRCQDIRRFGAAVLDLAWVACGRAEVYLEHVYPWDRAAGIVIVQEAGGMVCSFDGSPVPVTGFHDIIAGTPGVAREVVEITERTFG